MRILPFIHYLAILFSEIVIFMIGFGNKTSCRPIRSVLIILVINKSDSRYAVVPFCYHSYDYRLNRTPLSPITITYYYSENCLRCHVHTEMLSTCCYCNK